MFCEKILLTGALIVCANMANAWSQTSGSGTLGLATVEVKESGEVSINYEVLPGQPGAALRQGVQIHIYPWAAITTERSYFKLRSEYMSASFVDEMGHSGVLEANLDAGLYVVAFGQWHGISHDDPNDPYFKIDIDGPAEFISSWAGDVSIYNPAGRPPIAGEWGSIGKISAFWSQNSDSRMSLTSAFPGAKIVTGFGTAEYRGD